jgi:hypothetical protein
MKILMIIINNKNIKNNNKHVQYIYIYNNKIGKGAGWIVKKRSHFLAGSDDGTFSLV